MSSLIHDRDSCRSPKVSILMGTYNGADYLVEQLDSFASQTHANWDLWVSDDGSSDGSRALLEAYQEKWGERFVCILQGPMQGFTANFLSLTSRCDPADYYAFSDQDDIWEADKLERAVAFLQTVPSDRPALYCSRTRYVDSANREIGLSPLFCQPPSFANALIQSLGGGNTMVFNEAARQLICEAGHSVSVVAHDWWLYQLVSGCGGAVFYDCRPSLRYRQHGGNLIGMNSTWSARWQRFRMLLHGRFADWNSQNVAALYRMRHRLTPEALTTLQRFETARHGKLLCRLIGLKRCGIYRQTMLGNLGLVVAAIFNKI